VVKPAKETAMKKPKIRASSAKWFNEIDRYIRQYNLQGEMVTHAASDVLDGWATREELTDLIKGRLLRVIRFSRDRDSICGGSWTVGLTDKAIRIFWPDRQALAESV
jgi:hypothetical protein